MKTLVLIRHGKSSWEDYPSDLDRNLLPIGIQKTHKIGEYLKTYFASKDINPNIWLSSPANRATETADIITEKFGVIYQVIDDLYTFSSYEVERIVKHFDNAYKTVVIFGHNPAYTDFLNKFGTQEIFNLSTSGVGILNFKISDWKDLTKGKTEKIILPKDI